MTALVFWVAKDGFNSPNYVEAFTQRWIQLPSDASVKAQGLQSLGLGGPRADGIAVGCLIDSLTIVMFVILTLINVLVHMFALGSGPRRPELAAPGERRGNGPRFFALLQLFNFALLGLLLANSLVQLLVFWEILGVAAYFLVRLSGGSHAGAGRARGSLRMSVMNALGGWGACGGGGGAAAAHAVAGGAVVF